MNDVISLLWDRAKAAYDVPHINKSAYDTDEEFIGAICGIMKRNPSNPFDINSKEYSFFENARSAYLDYAASKFSRKCRKSVMVANFLNIFESIESNPYSEPEEEPQNCENDCNEYCEFAQTCDECSDKNLLTVTFAQEKIDEEKRNNKIAYNKKFNKNKR